MAFLLISKWTAGIRMDVSSPWVQLGSLADASTRSRVGARM